MWTQLCKSLAWLEKAVKPVGKGRHCPSFALPHPETKTAVTLHELIPKAEGREDTGCYGLHSMSPAAGRSSMDKATALLGAVPKAAPGGAIERTRKQSPCLASSQAQANGQCAQDNGQDRQDSTSISVTLGRFKDWSSSSLKGQGAWRRSYLEEQFKEPPANRKRVCKVVSMRPLHRPDQSHLPPSCCQCWHPSGTCTTSRQGGSCIPRGKGTLIPCPGEHLHFLWVSAVLSQLK